MLRERGEGDFTHNVRALRETGWRRRRVRQGTGLVTTARGGPLWLGARL